MNESYGYVLGVLDGDGCISSQPNHGKIEPIVKLEVTDRDFAEYFLTAIKNIAPWITASVGYRKAIADRGEVKDKQIVTVGATKLLPLIRIAQAEKMESQKEPVVCAYLRGYFDSEGSITHYTVQASSINAQLIWHVETLLLNLGIKSRVYEHIKNNTKLPNNKFCSNAKEITWIKICRYRSRKVFAEKVGFTIGRKQKALQTALGSMQLGSYTDLQYQQALKLRGNGAKLREIAHQIKVPMGTVCHWVIKKSTPWEAKK